MEASTKGRLYNASGKTKEYVLSVKEIEGSCRGWITFEPGKICNLSPRASWDFTCSISIPKEDRRALRSGTRSFEIHVADVFSSDRPCGPVQLEFFVPAIKEPSPAQPARGAIVVRGLPVRPGTAAPPAVVPSGQVYKWVAFAIAPLVLLVAILWYVAYADAVETSRRYSDAVDRADTQAGIQASLRPRLRDPRAAVAEAQSAADASDRAYRDLDRQVQDDMSARSRACAPAAPPAGPTGGPAQAPPADPTGCEEARAKWQLDGNKLVAALAERDRAHAKLSEARVAKRQDESTNHDNQLQIDAADKAEREALTEARALWKQARLKWSNPLLFINVAAGDARSKMQRAQDKQTNLDPVFAAMIRKVDPVESAP